MPPAEGAAGGAAVAGVLLAAGSSLRMGQNKLLLALGGESVVRRAVRTALEAGLAPLVVVLGHEAERVRAELDGLPCQPVVNADHADGKGKSLQVGIAAAASTGADAAVVVLADMPFVTAAMLAEVVERHRSSGAPMVVSRYGQIDAPPMLYHRSLYAELLSLTGQTCGKQMVRRHAHDAAIVSLPEEALADIDVAADYQRIRADLAGR